MPFPTYDLLHIQMFLIGNTVEPLTKVILVDNVYLWESINQVCAVLVEWREEIHVYFVTDVLIYYKKNKTKLDVKLRLNCYVECR